MTQTIRLATTTAEAKTINTTMTEQRMGTAAVVTMTIYHCVKMALASVAPTTEPLLYNISTTRTVFSRPEKHTIG